MSHGLNCPCFIVNPSESDRCLFLKEIFIYLFLAGLGLHCCIQFSSGCGEGELLSSCGARASPCSGFSCCRAVALLDFSSCST